MAAASSVAVSVAVSAFASQTRLPCCAHTSVHVCETMPRYAHGRGGAGAVRSSRVRSPLGKPADGSRCE